MAKKWGWGAVESVFCAGQDCGKDTLELKRTHFWAWGTDRVHP